MEQLFIVRKSWEENSKDSMEVVRHTLLHEILTDFFEEMPFTLPAINGETTIEAENTDKWVQIVPLSVTEMSIVEDVILHTDPDIKFISWSSNDFLSKCIDVDYYLDKGNRQLALSKMMQEYESETGINWQIVQYYILEQLKAQVNHWQTIPVFKSADQIKCIDDIATWFYQLTVVHNLAWHPDNAFDDYITTEKTQVFSPEECAVFDIMMEHCISILADEKEEYEIDIEDLSTLAILVDNTIIRANN